MNTFNTTQPCPASGPLDFGRENHSMIRKTNRLGLALLCLLLIDGRVLAASPAEEERSLTELRNTVINLLQALVDKGVLTREQAQAMVHDAQVKAEQQAAAKVAQEKAQEEADKGAVRVPYVPQIVKEEIRKEVVAELGPSVKQEVVNEVSSKDSLRSALPEWVQLMHWSGDVRTRIEGDNYGHSNAQNTYFDYNVINAKGGKDQAGVGALYNTTLDRDRLRVRVRFGFDADLGAGFTAGAYLATGAGEVYITTNQTEGTYGARYQVALDQGYLRWTNDGSGRQLFSAEAGRFARPFLGTDLVWYNDMTFEGIATDYRLNFSSDNAHRHDFFLTLGGFPLQDVTPSSQDKWLLAGQLGADIHTQNDSFLRFGAAYYDYVNIAGRENPPDSTIFNYTAPALVQKGNTMFDIANSTAATPVNLYALAADFRIVDLMAVADWHVFSHYSMGLTAEALKNIGYNTSQILLRTGAYIPPRTRGYRADLSFGSHAFDTFGSWRAAIGYRYLQRDAVVDAFNDQDFHFGGTDAKGYTATFDYAFNPRVWLRMKYLAADAIDGPPLTIDVWQVDLNARF